jgi:methanogenic corrinoid protein MtbC1
MSVLDDRPPSDGERLAMLTALVDGDVSLAHRIAVDLLAEGVTFEDIVDDILSPVQHELGRRWAAGELGIADEHAASAASEQLITRLGATLAPPDGPSVVIACAEHDHHALGGRIVAGVLTLEGFHARFLGASVPAADLAEYLDLQQPLALALSVSISGALASAARSVAAAHDIGVPVIAGGRALTAEGFAERVGIDAHAQTARDAVQTLRAWEQQPPELLASAPEPVPEMEVLERSAPALVTAALASVPDGPRGSLDMAEELRRLLRVVEGALLLEEPRLVVDHVEWLRATGPAHGVERPTIDRLVNGLTSSMADGLDRARTLLRATR